MPLTPLVQKVRLVWANLRRDTDSSEYKAWQHRFLRERLDLGCRVALICSSTIIASDVYHATLDPSATILLFVHGAMVLCLCICWTLQSTKVGYTAPKLLFLGLSWSITIVPHLVAAFLGAAPPYISGWTLASVFLAMLFPIHWHLHVVSQLGVLACYFGVKAVFGHAATELSLPSPVVLSIQRFWLCFVCDLAVFLYERLQRSEFESRRQLQVFLHGVSHDLRNPVTGTLMVLNNLLQKSDSTIPVPRSILEQMAQGSDRQLKLINSLLEAHASDVRGVVLHCQPLQLSTLVQSAVIDLEPLLEKNQASLKNLVSEDLPLVSGDSIQLLRVFSNLISNALKHNPPGLRLIINATIEPKMIRCCVQDNGVGLSQQQCDRLFELYFRSSHTSSCLGLGLGLYLCRQIITAHGGEIGVTSSPGAGATFWFTLPIDTSS